MNKTFLILALVLILLPGVIAGDLRFKPTEDAVISLPIYNEDNSICGDCSCVVSINYPNGSLMINNMGATEVSGQAYITITKENHTTLGTYPGSMSCNNTASANGFSTFSYQVGVSPYLMIILFIGAIIFFIVSIFVEDQIIMYISGVLFLIGGMYTLIYGFDIYNDMYTQTIGYIGIGLGLILTLGAYLYNHLTYEGGFIQWDEAGKDEED